MRTGYGWREVVGKTLHAAVIAGVSIGLATGVAHALSEWWTPEGMRCPIFDSADACQGYCAADASRCGGASECTFRTGATRPMCAPASKNPEPSTPPDGWQGPATR